MCEQEKKKSDLVWAKIRQRYSLTLTFLAVVVSFSVGSVVASGLLYAVPFALVCALISYGIERST